MGFPFYRTCQLANSEDFDFRVWIFPGLSGAVEDSADGALSLLRAVKFIIIGLDFGSFFTWFFLCSFRHHFGTLCRTEMAGVKQTQKDDSIRHVWNFLWLECRQVGFWCQCIWFGFLGPNKLDRTTSQEQLETCLIVGLLETLWSSWSLLRCLQTHTTKLLDAKIRRLREHNQ